MNRKAKRSMQRNRKKRQSPAGRQIATTAVMQVASASYSFLPWVTLAAWIADIF
jgi:hypothetical protein